MRGRVAVLILSFLFVSAGGFGQCSYSPLYSGQYRSTALDLAIDGNDLWTATSYGVTLYDRSVDPPSLVASLPIPDVTRIVRVGNGLAYVGSGATIYVIARSGSSLRIAGSADAGGTVNDLIVLGSTIYAATSNGIVQFDLFDPHEPLRSMSSFATSSLNVLSLALSGSTLYAADGDSSVEVFSVSIPTLPQKTGTISSLPRSSAVKLSGTKLFVSDGQQTEVFLSGGGSKVASMLFGSSAFTPLTSDVVFAAGNDRTLRAVDYTAVASPVELFETTLAPSSGTVNRIMAMQIASGRLYVAAGDVGLLTYDVSAFTTPFPVHGYEPGPTTSIVSLGSKVYATPAGGSIVEYSQSASGQLTQARQWSSQTQHVYDGTQGGFLISASGATLTYWSLVSTTPTAISSVTFAKSVVSAVLVGNLVYAVLADRSLATADMSQLTPVASAFPIAGASPSSIARSGSAVTVSDVRGDGTTQLLFFSNPSATAVPLRATVAGLAIGSPVLSGTTAAIFTFSGINLVDFSSPTPSPVVIPGSNAFIPQSLAMIGTTLIEVTDRALLVWDTRTLKLTRQLPLPDDAVAVHVSPDAQSDIADVATTSGVTSVAYRATTQTPALLAATGGNAYYKKIAATSDRMYLYDGRGVDIFTTASNAPHFVASVRTGGMIDLAASNDTLFTLSSGGTVTSYSRDGALLAGTTISGGSDAQWLAISAVNGAPWVSYSTGCLSGGCQKITLILDSRQLVQTASVSGAVIEVATSGTKAFAIFDLPSEIRAYDVTDPLHPSAGATRATEGTKAPVSIAAANGVVYVIGDRLYAYDAATLTNTSTQLDAWTPDPNPTVVYVDQRIRADGGCAVVTGRTFAPRLFTLPQFGASAAIATPAAVKSLASQNGRLLLLTDDSLEIWSASASTPKPRRRATR